MLVPEQKPAHVHVKTSLLCPVLKKNKLANVQIMQRILGTFLTVLNKKNR
jgi:hypothetical protein